MKKGLVIYFLLGMTLIRAALEQEEETFKPTIPNVNQEDLQD